MSTITFPRTGTVGPGVLQQTRYQTDPERVVIVVNGGRDPSTHTVLTINPWEEPLAFDEVAIKHYSGREDVPAQLVALGVLAPAHRTIVQGFVPDVPVCRVLVELPEYRR